MMSFFIVVDFTHEMAFLLHMCVGFEGIWPHKCGRPSFRPPKGNSFLDYERLEKFYVKIQPLKCQ